MPKNAGERITEDTKVLESRRQTTSSSRSNPKASALKERLSTRDIMVSTGIQEILLCRFTAS